MSIRLCCLCLEVLAATWLVACGEPHLPQPHCPGVEILVGFRALASEPAGLVAWFEPDDGPVLRLPPDGTFVAAVETADDLLPLAVSSEVRRDGHRVVRLVPPPGRGSGRLVVQLGGCRVSVAAHWRPKDDPLGQATPAVEAELLRQAENPREGVWARGRHAALVARTDVNRGITLFTEAARHAAGVGHFSEASANLRSAAFHLIRNHRFAEATQALDEAEARLGTHFEPEGRARLLYYRGRVAAGLFKRHEAEGLITRAAEQAWQIGDDASAINFSDHRAVLLSEMGRHREASIALGALGEATEPRLRWGQLQNDTWYRLQAHRACQMEGNVAELQARLTELAAQAPPGLRPAERANAWANVAYAAWLALDFEAAERALAAMWQADAGGGVDPLFARRLEANLFLDRGDAVGAETAFKRFGAEAEQRYADRFTDDGWRALYGLGRIQRLRGAPEEALATWREAAAILDRVSGRVSLQAGRSSFHGDRRELLDAMLALLLEEGRLEEALRVADRFRAPVLRALEQEAALQALSPEKLAHWSALIQRYEALRRERPARLEACETGPLDQAEACSKALRLAEQEAARQVDEAHAVLAGESGLDRPFAAGDLAADEALVAWLPVRAARGCGVTWHRLVVVGGRVERLQAIEDIAKFVGTGRWPGDVSVRHVYVMDGGSAEARGLPALEVEGQPLAIRVGITFIPRLSWLKRPLAATASGVLVVADPDGTLPAASRNGEALKVRYPSAQVLLRAAATREAVLPALDGLRWFQFEGHGEVTPEDPWNGHLRLAHGATLTTADILAHRPQVGTVVLAACMSADAGQLSETESLGLAEAFLLAGADQVLAADGRVPDTDAAAFIAQFHAEGGPTDAVGAWQRTLAIMHKKNPAKSASWRQWRFFGRRLSGGG